MNEENSMRNILRLMLLIPVFFTLLSFNVSGKEAVGKISFYVGRVFVIPAGTTELAMATFNKPLFAGDKIETKKESRCEITLATGDVIRVDANSLFTLEIVEMSGKSVKTESSLQQGKVWNNIKKIFTDEGSFKVKSPSAVIAVRGTIYRVDANPDSTTDVKVYDGEVAVTPYSPGMGQGAAPPQQPGVQKPQQVAPPQQVSGPQEVSVETWMEIVKAQQQILVRPNGTFQRSEFNLEEDAKSDWVQWNLKRDQLLEEQR